MNNHSNHNGGGPRVVTIHKSETGFGFNVRGQVSEGGQWRPINGELYPPLQHVSAVLEGGAAEKAGVRRGDRILEVNGASVEGAEHRYVVELIKQGGDALKLTVISVSQKEAERLEPSDETSGFSYIDYSEKRSLPISIPDYSLVESRTGEKYVVYNIYMAGRHLCARRYREFFSLHNELKKEFPDFNFPKLPGKWPFTLTEQQIDSRRRGLEVYLERVCAVKVIAESSPVHHFLNDNDTVQGMLVDLKVQVPDGSLVCVAQPRTATAAQVFAAAAEKLQLPKHCTPYWALFEIVEYNFERKVGDDELPHHLYIQNYSTATATCLAIHRWVFDPQRELVLCEDDRQHLWLYHLAVEGVNRGHITPTDALYQLKALQDPARKHQYLQVPCPLLLGILLKSQVIEFAWDSIDNYEVNEEALAFCFSFRQSAELNRWVKIFTPYSHYLADCFERVLDERRNEERRGDNRCCRGEGEGGNKCCRGEGEGGNRCCRGEGEGDNRYSRRDNRQVVGVKPFEIREIVSAHNRVRGGSVKRVL
ncbi:Ras-associating (RA) domain [Trinorchestia longiramus]|nr:Ras-associating (RA) domain [Trinorchestia longiramus]